MRDGYFVKSDPKGDTNPPQVESKAHCVRSRDLFLVLFSFATHNFNGKRCCKQKQVTERFCVKTGRETKTHLGKRNATRLSMTEGKRNL